MDSLRRFSSPLSFITAASDGEALVGLWFEGQKYFGAGLEPGARAGDAPVFAMIEKWLSLYFGGQAPDFTPPLRLRGTAFQRAVWNELLAIPYGETVTYGQIARKLAEQTGKGAGAFQAVGGAVGKNPISLIVPCHRVVGADGSLTGYAGGVEKKRWLLQLERGGKGLAI